MVEHSTSEVRLAELVAALSLATDLGLGQPQEHVLRQTVIATRVAALVGLSDEDQAATFYVSLLAWVGCVADSHELARWFGDDTKLRADSYAVDRTGLPMLRFLLGHLETDGPALQRLTFAGRFLTGGIREAMGSLVGHCQTTGEIADRLDLPGDVRRCLLQTFERWDGKGVPEGLAGEGVAPVMRVVQIANETEVFSRIGGAQAAMTMLRERSGSAFDPNMVDQCCRNIDAILGDLATVDAWDVVIDGCSGLDRRLGDEQLTAVLAVFADYADLKSPWFLGHSRAAASLAAEAARRAGLGIPEATLVERAGLVARLGGIGVSAGIWDKPGPLSAIERERVRTVPYLTERVLSHQPRLAEIGALAGMTHERMDGSGYPRGLSGGAIPVRARLLAAADVYQALSEERPQRPGLRRPEREAVLQEEVAAGRLDGAAAAAVLSAAGHQVRRRAPLVAGLTGREVEVLALLVRGWPNKRIATHLSISTGTVGTHVEHIYAKIGVTTRGAAAMFAMRHGLVDATASEDAAPQKIR